MADVPPLEKLTQGGECHICCYSMAGPENEPKFLKCGHVICESCLGRWSEPPDNGIVRVECPECRVAFYRDVRETLPTVYQLKDLCEVIADHSHKWADSLCKGCDTQLYYGCEKYCVQCQDKLVTELKHERERYVFKIMDPYDRLASRAAKGYSFAKIIPKHVVLRADEPLPLGAELLLPQNGQQNEPATGENSAERQRRSKSSDDSIPNFRPRKHPGPVIESSSDDEPGPSTIVFRRVTRPPAGKAARVEVVDVSSDEND